MTTIRVRLSDRSYDIHVGPRMLQQTGPLIAAQLRHGAPTVIPVVTDKIVAALHYRALEQSLSAAAVSPRPIVLPPGEGAKSFGQLEQLVDQLLAANVERGSLIVAFGGGVIGDLTGFAAGIIKRGIDFVQIPTTLLAQVDSSVGGKTAINTQQGKNLVGVFHQPRLVIADTLLLSTLPRRELLSGDLVAEELENVLDNGVHA